MRKIGYKSARADKWETFLQKFLTFTSAEEESIQLERNGYCYLSLTTKLQILFQLCLRQFDHNLKFKETVSFRDDWRFCKEFADFRLN